MRRKLKKKWLNSGLVVDHEIYRCLKVSRMCEETKSQYYSELIKDNCGNQKVLFNISRKLLGNDKVKSLPTHERSVSLPEKFKDFFSEKVSKIRKSILALNEDLASQSFEDVSPVKLTSFGRTSSTEIDSIIKKSTSAQCELDPIPTSLVKHSCLLCFL